MSNDTKKFLEHIWPDQGFYCISTPKTSEAGHFYYAHKVFDSIDSATSAASTLKRYSANCFMVIGSLGAEKIWDDKDDKWVVKSQANVAHLKTFILDLDVGEKKPYADKKAALDALKRFCATAGLPKPTIVDSGGGIHVYFTLTSPIDSETWKTNALKLKAIGKHTGLGQDNSRTADCSSLLRVVGTDNWKKDHPRPVKVLYWGEPTDPEEFAALLDRFIGFAGVKTIKTSVPSYLKEVFGDAKSNIVEYETPDAKKVIAGCPQLAFVLEKRGDVSEPLWRAALSVTRLFEPPMIEEFSDGHPEYEEGKTADKLAGLEGGGPFLCTTFEQEERPDLCKTCPHYGKISSPIVLGRRQKSLPAPEKPKPVIEVSKQTFENLDVDEVLGEDAAPVPDIIGDILTIYGEQIALPNPPYPYKRTAAGVYIEAEGDDTGGKATILVYQYDIYPYELITEKRDEGIFTTKIMIKLPHGNDKSVTVPFRSFADPFTFNKTMADAGVLTITNDQAGELLIYMKSYINEIQKLIKPVNNYVQLGWTEDEHSFVLPDKCIHEDGRVEECGTSKVIRNSVASFRKKGTLEEWKKVIDTYTRPGYEPYAFGHLGGYASLLFTFTQYEGAIINFVGNSGSGKSTVLQTINSIFGHPKEPMLLHHDKYLAKIDRLGVFNSVCVTYDEITNIEPEELSDLCYSVTQGRGRHRLNQNAEIKENNTKWKMLLVSSSNSNLMGKLSSLKHDASAESLRVFEYTINTSDTMTKQEAAEAFSRLADNFGHAGEIFVNYVIQHKAEVRDLIDKLTLQFDAAANVPTNERYWSAIVACALAGGVIAKKLNLCSFDIKNLFHWCVAQVRLMRGVVKENTKDARALLVDFLNQHVNNTMVIGGGEKDKSMFVREEPRAALLIRNEIDRGLAYVSKSAMKAWLVKGGGDYGSVRKTLIEARILLDDDCNKTLSAGSNIVRTGQSKTWLVNLNHHEMVGNVLLPSAKLAEDAEVDKVIDIMSAKGG